MNFDRETRRDVGIYQAMLLRVLPAANAPVSLWRFSIQFVADGRLLVTLGCLVSLLFCGFWPSKTVAQADVTGEKILVLFYNNSFSEFKQEFGAGVQDYLQNNRNDLPNIRLSYEYLGLGGVPQNIRPDVIIDMLKFKQQFDPASLVISVLYPTANFLNSFGEEIYGDIPIIYTFPSAEMADLLAAENRRDITIIRSIQNLRIRNSLALIPKLIPETAHLYVISGSSDIDLILKTSTAASLSSLMPEMQVTYLTGLPIEELSSRVSNLAENSAIFMLSYGEDRNHSALRAIDILPLIIDRADLPIFTPISSLFPQGVVGGSFSSAALAGRNSAESAIAMLRGGDSAAAGIDGPAYYQFDQRQLRRWGIDEELLPPNSTIVNQTSTFLELYAQQLLILLSVVAVLLTVVAFFKRQANNLGTQKTLFESVINSIPDAIFITNADAQIFATNKGAEQLFAFSKGELLGRYVRSLMDYSVVRADEIPSGLNVLQRSIEPQVLKYKKKNGEVFPGETIATQITSSSGEMLGHFALIRDISKRLSLEEEQRQGQKMEALGNLVGGISHDFNNILGVISGYAELSKMTKESESIDANQNQILKATDRAKSLVSQIIAFSRDSDIEQKPTDLAALLDETIKLIEVSILSNIEITVEKGAGVQPIMGSPIQLQQILINLTTNSYQAMKSSGGSITIALHRKHIGTEMHLSHGVLSPGHYSVLSVADNGPGMSSEVASRIFEPYFTTKAHGEGSGMGMAIVYNLVKAHSASLDLKTAPGEGTCITLYFKETSDIGAAADAANSVAVVRGQGERILLVDDEEDLLEGTQQLLSSIGYRVTAFSDPDVALQTFERAPLEFDLLLTDQSMPKITGMQLLEHVVELNPLIAVIICTGYSDSINQQELGHGALNSVLRKPYTLGEISSAISSALTAQR